MWLIWVVRKRKEAKDHLVGCLEDGEEVGTQDGMEDGMEDGVEDGMEDGTEDGMEAGTKDGVFLIVPGAAAIVATGGRKPKTVASPKSMTPFK